MVIWYIFPALVFVPRKIWQPWQQHEMIFFRSVFAQHFKAPHSVPWLATMAWLRRKNGAARA
jgi:hypothetical protein